MRRIECPNCGSFLDLDLTVKLGHIFNCPDCETELTVVNVEPCEVDYYYGEDYDTEYSEDYDEYSDYYEEEEYNDFDPNYYDLDDTDD